MSDNIIPMGETEFCQHVEHEHDTDAEALVHFLIEALDKGYSREPLASLIAEGWVRKPFGSNGLYVFLSWCSQVFLIKADEDAEGHDFQPTEHDSRDEAASDMSDWSNDLDDHIAETVVNAFASLQERTETLQAYGSKHKYWFFRPGWQVESALWDQIFEEHDPALTIGFYLSTMFRNERKVEADGVASSPAGQGRWIKLSETDQGIILWILETYAEILAKSNWKNRRPPPREVILRCLITATNLDDVLGGGITWKDPDFCEAVSAVPSQIAAYLLAYWANINFYNAHVPFETKGDVDYEEDGVGDLVSDQADYITACILKYLGVSDHAVVPEPPEDLSFDDATLLWLLENLRNIHKAVGGTESYKRAVAGIYRARQTVFGGVYPFTVFEAEEHFSELRGTRDFWLSDIVLYGPENDQDDRHPFWVFVPGQRAQEGRDHTFGVRTNRRAVERFECYKQALDSIQADGLDELAAAWWAFFIASQTMAFRGLALPPSQIRQTVQTAASLLPSDAIERALQFALEVSLKMANPLEARVTKAAIARHLARDQNANPETENIVAISARSHQVEKFLAERIGRSVWMQLEQQPRADLIQAEQLFSMSYQDLGAGRSDWGPLVTLYARTVEAEIKRRLMPIIKTAEAVGACKAPKALTLGGCKNITVTILQWLDKSPQGQLPMECIQKLKSLHQLFAEHSFLVETRNRAAHADRANPVEASALLMWREAMFHKGLFGAIIA